MTIRKVCTKQQWVKIGSFSIVCIVLAFSPLSTEAAQRKAAASAVLKNPALLTAIYPAVPSIFMGLLSQEEEVVPLQGDLKPISPPAAVPRTTFGFINYAVLTVYLAMNLLVGIYFAYRQKNTNDYFRGGQRISWWAAGIAIFGTQLSSLSFMAVPAKTYATDWTYISAAAAVILIAPLVVLCYLPFFRRLDITSAYEYLEKRFNLGVRLFGSCAFVLMQTGRMAIVLYLPALALSVVSDLNIYVCLLTMGMLSTIYTMLGGAEAVTWTEVLQFFVLVGSALLTLFLIFNNLNGGVEAFYSTARNDGKLQLAVWSWDYTIASIWVVLIGNLFAQLVPYTSDQAVIQRYLTTPDEKQAARAIWLNALFTIPSAMIFYGIGTALYVFYKQNPHLVSTSLQNDAIFPWFIVNQMPVGLSGLVIAGLFAAGQSGSQASIATAIVTDFYKRLNPKAEDWRSLRLARWLTLLLGIVGISAAGLMATYPIKSVWDIFLTILGLFGGSLAGVFALGIFTKRAHTPGAIFGIVLSVLTLFLVQRYTAVHFFLYAGIGIITCVGGGYIASLLIPAKEKSLEGLTIFTMRKREPKDHSPERRTDQIIVPEIS
jgi:SSS family solute:Na+ symporter